MDADLKTADHQCTDGPCKLHQAVKCKGVQHFLELPGSLPAQPSVLWAACPWRCTHRGRALLFPHSASPWQPSWTNLVENQEPLTQPGFARSQVHGHAWNLEALELLLQTSCKMWLIWNTIIPSTLLLKLQYWQQQSYWVRRTESLRRNPYTPKSNSKNDFWECTFFFLQVEQKMLKKHTEIIIKLKLLLVQFKITIMFCRGFILHLPNAGLHFSQNSFPELSL